MSAAASAQSTLPRPTNTNTKVHTLLTPGPPPLTSLEMGPMRFPESIFWPPHNRTYPINDHKLVFQLASTLNRLHGNDPRYKIDFIPWYQTSPNGNGLVYLGGKRKPDGDIPTAGEIQADPALAYVQDNGQQTQSELDSTKQKIADTFLEPEKLLALAEDMFRAHKKFIGRWFNSPWRPHVRKVVG